MMMIEGSADQMLKIDLWSIGIYYEQIQDIISAQNNWPNLREEKKEFELVTVLKFLFAEIAGNRMEDAIFADSKQERQDAVDIIKEEALSACEEKFGEELNPDHVKMAFEIIQEEVYRENILVKGKRADGRQPADLREITCETGVLPRVHGSAIFTRGKLSPCDVNIEVES